MKNIKIAIVDDHKMVSKALEDMIMMNSTYKVCMNCSNGDEFLSQLENSTEKPEVVLMDINMPFRNGIETTQFLTKKFPEIKVIALTMEDNENTIIRMLKAGAKGYLLKDMSPEILFEAINTVHMRGSFYTDIVSEELLKMKAEQNSVSQIIKGLKDKEREFIKLACSELTYREIADEMCMSHKTIDGYRDNVFVKFDVKSRVGLVLFAIKHNLD